MKLPGFDYRRPESLPVAVALLAEFRRDAVVLAGGQSLVPLMARRARRPRVVVDLNGIASLSHLRVSGGFLQIGAMTRQRVVELNATIAVACPLIASAAGMVGHVSVRNRGTIGGSIAYADPAAEIPTAALALGAEVVVTGPRGERSVAMRNWIAGPFTTVLAADELVTAIRIPLPRQRTGSALHELSQPTGGRPVTCVAAVVETTEYGDVCRAEVAVSGRGAPPTLVDVTRNLDDGTAADAVAAAMRFAEPVPESNGPPSAYCRDVARVLGRRALAEATQRVREEDS